MIEPLHPEVATGAYDMRFSVHDATTGGTLIAPPFPLNAVGVTNGLFTARIDFGAGVFTGPARWMEISVRQAGAGTFETLSPRQELTSSPYLIRAQTAGTASDVANGSVVKSLNSLRDNISLAAGAKVTFTPSGNTLTIAAPGGGTGGGPWLLNGNSAYYNAGNVGIGTSNTTERLTIAGVPSYNTGLKLTGNTDNGTGLALENTFAGGHKYSFLSGGLNTGVGAGGFGIFDDTALDYRFVISAYLNTSFLNVMSYHLEERLLPGQMDIWTTNANDARLFACLGRTWFVATDGSDANSGTTPATAFATIGRAQDNVEGLNDVILLRGGTYAAPPGNRLNVPVTFCGTRGPVTIVAP